MDHKAEMSEHEKAVLERIAEVVLQAIKDDMRRERARQEESKVEKADPPGKMTREEIERVLKFCAPDSRCVE